jgi:hypothetical protein
MENTAMKMREIATAYHDAKEAKLREDAEGLVNTFLLKEIESHASEGDYSMIRHIPVPMRPYVKMTLEEMGFVVEKAINNNFEIKW